jgi:hypothetical protein
MSTEKCVLMDDFKISGLFVENRSTGFLILLLIQTHFLANVLKIYINFSVHDAFL